MRKEDKKCNDRRPKRIYPIPVLRTSSKDQLPRDVVTLTPFTERGNSIRSSTPAYTKIEKEE